MSAGSVLGFGHVNLRAEPALMAALRDFYVNVVGLAEGPRPPFPTPGHWLYAGGQDVLHLSTARPGEGTDGRSAYDHLALRCQDLSGTEERLHRLGVPFRRAEVPLTGQVQLFLRDPAGLGVELTFAPAR